MLHLWFLVEGLGFGMKKNWVRGWKPSSRLMAKRACDLNPLRNPVGLGFRV